MKAQIAPVTQDFNVFSQGIITLQAEVIYDINGALNIEESKATAKANDIDKLDLWISGSKGFRLNKSLSIEPETKTVLYENNVLVLSLIDWVMVIGFKERGLYSKYLHLCFNLTNKESSALERMFSLSVILPGINPILQAIEPARERNTRSGCVYFILTECELYLKVGFTHGSVEKRLAAIQTGCPINLKIAHIIECENPKQVEKDYHHKFTNYRTRGEWFNVTGEVKDFLAKVINYAK